MAFRSSASATGTGTGTITATPAGVQAHDYLGAWWLVDGSALPVLTPPVGWTQRASVQTSLDGQTQFYADKADASGSDAFGFADNAVNDKALITAAWSGRNNSAPRSATPVTTGNSASNTSPISATITGITAVNGDDIGIGLGTDDAAAGQRWTYSTITNYTEQVDGVAQDWVSGAGLQTRDNVSAGATGNFSVTITRGAGAGNSGYSGIVVAIAAAASTAAATPAPTPRLILYDRIARRGDAKMEVFDSLRGQPFAAFLPVDNTPQPTGAQNVPPLPPQPKVMMLEPWRRGPFTGPQPARIAPAVGNVTGTVSATDENDASAASGIVTVTGSIAASEANDTPSASGAITVTGTVAASEANDTPSITGTVTVTGTIAATEANDNSSASGTVATPTGTVTVTEGDDTATASGTVTLTGSVAATEADDTSSAFGTVPSATAPRQEQPAWPYELKLHTLSGRKSWLNS